MYNIFCAYLFNVILMDDEFNAMVADPLALYLSKSSATVLSAMEGKRVIVLLILWQRIPTALWWLKRTL